jgi:hypothetical protein
MEGLRGKARQSAARTLTLAARTQVNRPPRQRTGHQRLVPHKNPPIPPCASDSGSSYSPAETTAKSRRRRPAPRTTGGRTCGSDLA